MIIDANVGSTPEQLTLPQCQIFRTFNTNISAKSKQGNASGEKQVMEEKNLLTLPNLVRFC